MLKVLSYQPRVQCNTTKSSFKKLLKKKKPQEKSLSIMSASPVKNFQLQEHMAFITTILKRLAVSPQSNSTEGRKVLWQPICVYSRHLHIHEIKSRTVGITYWMQTSSFLWTPCPCSATWKGIHLHLQQQRLLSAYSLILTPRQRRVKEQKRNQGRNDRI